MRANNPEPEQSAQGSSGGADVQDRDTLSALGPDLAGHTSLLLSWLGRNFAGDASAVFLGGYGITAELVGAIGRKEFQVEPRHWKVEQASSGLQRYNLADFLLSLAPSREVARWSLTTLHDKLVKIGARIVSHCRYMVVQRAEVAVLRALFAGILRWIERLRGPPVAAA